jgi:hypothetical protein
MTAEGGLPQPGTDEIILTGPEPGTVCHSLGHARIGCLAEVVVTFGQMGTRWARDALWTDSWGRSYPMCSECWDGTRAVAQGARPGLVVTDAR